jgi:hypothetical protein
VLRGDDVEGAVAVEGDAGVGLLREEPRPGPGGLVQRRVGQHAGQPEGGPALAAVGGDGPLGVDRGLAVVLRVGRVVAGVDGYQVVRVGRVDGDDRGALVAGVLAGGDRGDGPPQDRRRRQDGHQRPRLQPLQGDPAAPVLPVGSGTRPGPAGTDRGGLDRGGFRTHGGPRWVGSPGHRPRAAGGRAGDRSGRRPGGF